MEKENLVLVHSFPTNSILLKGLIDYLNDYFNVYFIDLPGFVQSVPPLQKITLEGYSEFVASKMKEFNLDTYYIGGVSFGFMIISAIPLDSGCQGVFALEPFTNISSLSTSTWWRFSRWLPLEIICRLKLEDVIWNSRMFRFLFPKVIFTGQPKFVTDTMLNEINGRTFIQTARLLLNTKKQCHFQKQPYALIINKSDGRVSYAYLTQLFRENVQRLLIVDTTIEHYPKRTLLKSYFKTKFPHDEVEEIARFFEWESQKKKHKTSIVTEVAVA